MSKVTSHKPRLSSLSSIETANNVAMDWSQLFTTCLSEEGKSETNRNTLICGYSNSQNILNSSNSIPNYFNNRTYCPLHIPVSIIPCCAMTIPCQKYFCMPVVNNTSTCCAILQNIVCTYVSEWHLKKNNQSTTKSGHWNDSHKLYFVVQRKRNNPQHYTKTYLYCLDKTQPPSFFLGVHQIHC